MLLLLSQTWDERLRWLIFFWIKPPANCIFFKPLLRFAEQRKKWAPGVVAPEISGSKHCKFLLRTSSAMRYFHILSQVFRFRPPCEAKSSLFLGPAEKLRFLGYSGWKTIGFFQIALPGKATLVPDPGNEGVRDLSGYPSHGWPWLSNKVTWNGLEIPHDLRKPLYI